MSNKTIGIALMIIGVVVLAISLAADVIGIGQYKAAIGTWQILGAVAGGLVFIVGIVMALRKEKA